MADYSNSLWGDPTSLVNWCEPDYVHFSFIAESFNTLSNIPTIVVGFVLFQHFKRHECERRFLAATLLMMLVGFGSLLFHGTLKYHFQLADEIPMLYLTVCLSYIVIEMPHKIRLYSTLPSVAILSSIAMTLGHVWFKNAEIFFAAFGIFLAPAITYPLTHLTVPPFVRSMKYAFFSLLLGFSGWELDRFLCSYVQPLYLHAWWHLFTCLSGVFWLNAMVFLRKRYVLKEPGRLIYYGLWVDLNVK